MWGMSVFLFVLAGGLLAGLIAALVHQVRFHARVVPASAKIVRYDQRRVERGDLAVLRPIATVTFLDSSGSIIVSENSEPWEGVLLPVGAELRMYYDPHDLRHVRSRLPSRGDYLTWAILVVFFPGGLTAAGVLLWYSGW